VEEEERLRLEEERLRLEGERKVASLELEVQQLRHQLRVQAGGIMNG
jgi:hypothetical protein